MPSATSRQARYWFATIWPGHGDFQPPSSLPLGVVWLRGQKEIGVQGQETGVAHWHVFAAFKDKVRISTVIARIGNGSWEPSRSEAAEAYVWKTETRVEGCQFELGRKAMKRNSKTDYEQVKKDAIEGNLDNIPADIFVRCYSNLTKIRKDFMVATGMERRIIVFWGPTNTGKSHRAWNLAGWNAYPKSPTSIMWDGYRGDKHVVMEEFRGQIHPSHTLRWFDKYPVLVENKFGGMPLCNTLMIITSNLPPERWYPDLDPVSLDAILRRLEIYHVTSQEQDIWISLEPFGPPNRPENWIPPTEEHENTQNSIESTQFFAGDTTVQEYDFDWERLIEGINEDDLDLLF